MNKKFLKYVKKISKVLDNITGNVKYLEDVEFLADREYKPIYLSTIESSELLNSMSTILNSTFGNNKITTKNLSILICGFIAINDFMENSPICNNYLIIEYDRCQSVYSLIRDSLIIK